MNIRFAKTAAKHFDEEILFFKTWIDKPKALGAVLPTSSATARRMASVINPHSQGPVLELGPGTGVITKAILARNVKPEKLYSIEHTEAFLPQLRSEFPDVNIIHGDAFQLDEALPDMKGVQFDTIVSAVPLLYFPAEHRVNFVNDLLNRLKPGRPVVQISYCPLSPVPSDQETYSVEPLDWMLRNIPPARLWVFRRRLAS